MECFLNQTEIYKNGSLVRATAVSLLGANMDESLRKILVDAVESCFSKHESYKDPPSFARISRDNTNEKDNNQEISSCNFNRKFLVPCIEIRIFKNCPDDKKVASKECNALFKTYFEKK